MSSIEVNPDYSWAASNGCDHARALQTVADCFSSLSSRLIDPASTPGNRNRILSGRWAQGNPPAPVAPGLAPGIAPNVPATRAGATAITSDGGRLALVFPTSLSVTPANPAIQVGQTQQFAASSSNVLPLEEVRSVAVGYSEPATRQRQVLTRRSVQAVATIIDASRLELSPDELKAVVLLFYSLLDEKQRRLYAAAESFKLGHGGDRDNWPSFSAWTRTPSPADGASCWSTMSSRAGSAKSVVAESPWKKTPELVQTIKILLEHDTAGDPITGLRWTRKTPDKIAELLQQTGISISAKTVARLLHDMDYSLRVNRKQLATAASPDRDPQFDYISSLRDRFQRQGLPIIRVDTKKRELVGNFKNSGVTWDRLPRLAS